MKTVNGDIDIEAPGPITVNTVSAGGDGKKTITDRQAIAAAAAQQKAADEAAASNATQSTFLTEFNQESSEGGC